MLKEQIEKIKAKVQECLTQLENLELNEPCDKDPEIPDGVVLELPDSFLMRTIQNNKNSITHSPFNKKVGNNRWMSETLNGAFFSVNAWGFGGNAGGTQELESAFVSIFHEDNRLVFEWWVGGYHKNFNGRPADGWWTGARGGNDVKAYPRVGIGSASGQEVSTIGAPFNVPCKTTNGWKHVDQHMVKKQCGLPVALKDLPKLDIVVDYEMMSEFHPDSQIAQTKDVYGNYFMAVDSYLHDLSKGSRGIKTIDGINDTSGSIYNQPMRGLPNTTKEWAIMIWLAKSPYFETSGGKEIGRTNIEGHEYIIKYKIETASDKKFKYISFTRNVDATTINEQTGTINYNAFANFFVSDIMTQLIREANVKDIDGSNLTEGPNENLVLSDVNFGLELLSNPDMPNSQKDYPMSCEFKELCFKVEGFGEFGFRA